MAGSSSLRQVIVDDTDPSIRYTGADWFPTNPLLLNNGNFGPVYNATSHATTSSNTEFSFSFNGTSITVQGNIDMTTDPTTNVTDPAWQCIVDGESIPIKPFTFSESNWALCSESTLAPGEHLLTVQVQVQTRPFFLDGLVYTPMPGAVFPSAVLIYPDEDPAVTYSAGQWEATTQQQVTQMNGAHVTLNFHGTSATLISHIDPAFPPNASSGSYILDGGNPTVFSLPGLPVTDVKTKLFNSVVFTTPELTDGFHNLTVTYDGNNKQTPLGVKLWYVTNTTVTKSLAGQASPSGSTSASTASSPPSSSAATNTASGAPSPSRRANTGPIVGGIIGGISLVGVLLAILYVLRRRQSQHARDPEHLQPGYSAMRTAVDVPPYNGARRTISPFTSTSTTVSPPASSRSKFHPHRGSRVVKSNRPPMSAGEPLVLQHEDSGVLSVNVPQAASNLSGAVYEVLELPPGYTPT